MFQLTALYNQPEDPAAFDKHYDDVHAGLAAKIPGLQRFTVNRPGPDPDGNPPQYHLVGRARVGRRRPPSSRPSPARRARPRWPTCPTSPAPG